MDATLCALTALVTAQQTSAQQLSGQSNPGSGIVASPVFTGEQLAALPMENWLTNGGNTLNQRYSPLTQINRFNVQDLKALWKTEMGSGDQYKNGGQAQILHHAGTTDPPCMKT